MDRTENHKTHAVRASWPAALLVVILGLAQAAGGSPEPQVQAQPQFTPQVPAIADGRLVRQRMGQYNISAHMFIIGKLGDVGQMTIGETLRQNDTALEKSLTLAGDANAEQAKKNRDYHGKFNLVEVVPLRSDGSVDEDAVKEWRGYQKVCVGFLRLKKFQAENVQFFKDHVVATRESGMERTVDGVYDSLLSPLAYLMEHEVKVGETFETPYILNGKAHFFKSQVTGIDTFSEFKSKAYQIDISSFDKVVAEDKPTKDVWKKSGNIRIWFCKEGPYRNTILKMRIKFRWYLWLYFNLQKVEG